jgi:hypothetical protein
MGLHSCKPKIFWELDTINAFLDAKHYRTDGPVTVEPNRLIWHASEENDEETFCGTAMRNFCSREFWYFVRWEPPYTHELLADNTSFEWYSGGCSNPRECTTETPTLHEDTPDLYSLLIWATAIRFWEEYINQDPAEAHGVAHLTALEQNERLNGDGTFAVTTVWRETPEHLALWKELNPRCPISPTW